MPTPSIASVATTSSEVSVLAYSILYDISTGVPTITLTNHSTVEDADGLNWWYVISMPDGTPIHAGSIDNPDVEGATWTTIVVPESWPTPFGSSPYNQIEFSCTVPYICTLYVEDSTEEVFSLAVSTVICRPPGNTDKTQGNFGVATCTATTKCTEGKLLCLDNTIYSYKGSVGDIISSTWRLRYPLYDAENPTPDAVFSDTASVLFPLAMTGPGYNLIFGSYRFYDQQNGSAIQIQYKFNKVFAVWCGVDLCPLNCAIMEMYQLAYVDCGEVANVTLQKKLNQISVLYSQLVANILQPFCDENAVPNLIAQIKEIGGFDCDCNCRTGINPSPNNPSSGNSIEVPVYSRSTTTAPTNCPNTIYPAKVYTPDGLTFLGMAYSAEDLVAILNATALWNTYGFWFAGGNCVMGVFLRQAGTIVPPIQIDSATITTAVSGEQHYIINPTSTCGSGVLVLQSFPFTAATVDFGSGPVSLSAPVTSITDYITKLNAAAGKPAAVTFTYAPGVFPLYIQVNNTNSALYSTEIVLDACGVLSGTLDLQAVTTNGNVTNIPLVVGDVTPGQQRSGYTSNGFTCDTGGAPQGGLADFGAYWDLILSRDGFFIESFPQALTANHNWQWRDRGGIYASVDEITNKALYTQTSVDPYTNAGTPVFTSLIGTGNGSVVVPANTLAIGTELRIKGSGFLYNQPSGSNLLYLDFVFTDATSAVTTLYCEGIVNIPDEYFESYIGFELHMVILSASVASHGKVEVSQYGTTPVLFTSLTNAAVAFNRTHTQTLDVRARWDVGDGGGQDSTISIFQLSLEQLR